MSFLVFQCGPELAAADLIPSLIQNVAASETRCFSSWHTTCVDVLTRVDVSVRLVLLVALW